MDAAALRAEFPVLKRLAYLNAGTCGPIPRAALCASQVEWDTATGEGRGPGYYGSLDESRARQRAAYAALLRADPADVALTTSTSEGIVRVLNGLDLGRGDEVLTADDEHPGLLGPLLALHERRGTAVRTAPLAQIAEAVSAKTALVACSHVSWITGALAPPALAGLDVPVLLDGAQGVGAVPVDVRSLGCSFYAGSGQKWLCGPVGTGMLWIAPEWAERVSPDGLTYTNLQMPSDGLDAAPWPDARRHDSPAIALESVAAALAAHGVLDASGWRAVHERAIGLAARLAAGLEERGHAVAPRGATTLVSWESADPVAERARLAAAGVLVRDLPGTPYLRASAGAWNDDGDLERLLGALAG